MSAADEIACGRGSDLVELVPMVPLTFNPTTTIPFEWASGGSLPRTTADA